MPNRRPSIAVVATGSALAVLAGCWAAWGQGPGREADANRFEFLVVESFDAQYQGDTPGHVGRGGLGRATPRAALGDPVYRGADPVGKVSRLTWAEARQSLEVEFDPAPNTRIQIGDPVWIRLGPGPASR